MLHPPITYTKFPICTDAASPRATRIAGPIENEFIVVSYIVIYGVGFPDEVYPLTKFTYLLSVEKVTPSEVALCHVATVTKNRGNCYI